MAPHLFWTTQAPVLSHRTRYTDPVSGIRFYPIEVDGRWLAVPGVTSLLSRVFDTEEDRQRLRDWRDREVAAGRDPNAGRDRGTRVHALIESYIRTGVIEAQQETDADFFSGLEQHLDKFDSFIWSERPLVQGWEHCWNAPEGSPERLARVVSTIWGLAGTPDLIATRRGLTWMGDYKTSTKPYFRCSGSSVPQHQAISYKKYCKTVRQLIAYTLAAEEMIPGLHIDGLQILVALPERGKTQSFLIERRSVEFEREAEVVRQSAVQFWRLFGQGQTAPAAVPLALPAAAAA